MKIIRGIIKIVTSFDQFGSFMMKSLLRLNGAKIGKNTFVSFSSRIFGIQSLVVGNDSCIKARVKLKAKNINIGNNCIISEYSYITGNEDFKIGDNSFIGKKVRINVSKNVIIGTNVGIGENSAIWTHGYFPPADEGYPITYAPVEIGDGSWISTNIIILPGVKIGCDVVVGAGSVITKSFDDHCLIAGNPAKFIKSTSEFKKPVSFLKLMSDILSNYDVFRPILIEDTILKYRINKRNLYVIDGMNETNATNLPEAGSLVIFKNIKHPEIFANNNFKWFDLTKRTMCSKKSQEINLTVEILRSYGIRLLKEYA
jgi:acetyltransferase-like isoleucine patch superfamily enzyme